MEEQKPPVEAAVGAYGEVGREADAIAKRLADLHPPTPEKPQDALQLFAHADRARKKLEAAAERAKQQASAHSARALAALQELGLQNAPLAGGPTVYQERTLWANPAKDPETEKGDYERACDALEAAGLDEYVLRTFNVQSLSAFFRERERQLEDEVRARENLAPDAPVAVDPDDLFSGELAPLKGRIQISEAVKAKARQS